MGKTTRKSSPQTAPTPDLGDLRDLRDVAPTPKPTSLQASTDDHLSTYFRDLAVHELLGPDQEREIARGIEDQEILTWERVFARAEAVPHVVALLEGKLEQPISWKAVLKAAAAIAEAPKPRGRSARPDSAQIRRQRALDRAAHEVAGQLRPLDLDRTLIDLVRQDLGRLVSTEKDYASYLAGIDAAYQGSSALREEFVRANLRLVVTMARRYDRGGMPLPDLIQEGNLGLMHAVSRFDHRRGLRFSTYACWWIRHAIGRALADKARTVRIPVHMLEAQQQLEKVRQKLIAELGRQPTPQELAKAARVPLAKLDQLHRYLMGQPMSLDRPVHEDDDRSLGDVIADPTSEDASPADEMTTGALSEQVVKLLRGLSPIEADVLRQRFGLVDDQERTFREIGDQYQLSRERIRQIQNAALDKLKKALGREHPGLFEH